MFLLDATPHPVEAHVKLYGAFPVHVYSGDAMGGFTGSFDWRGRLRMAHLNQGCADGNNLPAVEEKSHRFQPRRRIPLRCGWSSTW